MIKYIISAILDPEKQSKITRNLYYTGFRLWLYNPFTREIKEIKDNYLEKIVHLDKSLTYKFIYNGETLPPQSILRKLEEDDSVLEYTIEKRRS